MGVKTKIRHIVKNVLTMAGTAVLMASGGTVQGAGVVKVGDSEHEDLQSAVAAVQDGGTITVLSDIIGVSGLSVDTKKSFTVDFGGHVYEIGAPGAGSKGTETNGLRLGDGQTLTFRNGTIRCSEANKSATWTKDSAEKGIATLIQNYANLTLENMTIDGRNIAHNGGASARYIVSCNSGKVAFTGSTSITAPEGDVAFDSCKFQSYVIPSVTVDTTGTITGFVELSGGNVTLTAGTLAGSIRIAGGLGEGVLTKSAAFEAAAPADYKWDENGNLVAKTYVAQVGETKYESLQKALDDGNDTTVTLLSDVTLTAPLQVPAGKSATVIGGDFTVTASGVIATIYGSLTIAGGKFVSGNTAFKVLGEGSISVTNGEISAQEMCIAAFDGGRISVSGGSLTSLDNAVLGTNGSAGRGGNTINVSGGTLVGNIKSAGYIACGIYVANSDTVTVSGGTITVNGGVGILARAGKVSVTGGTITTTGETTGWVGDNKNMIASEPLVFDAAAQYPGLKEGDGIAVSGGAFSAVVPEAYCANGYIPTVGADGICGVKQGSYIARVGEAKYESVQEAVDAANGATVTLLKNVLIVAPLKIAADQTVRLDFGEFAAEAPKAIAECYGSLTIAGGMFFSHDTAFKALNGGTISVTGGGIWAQEMCIAAFDGGRISVSGGSLTSLDNAVLGTNGTAGRGGNTINVSGGTLVGNIKSAGYIACGIYVANSDTVTVSGGTITVNGGVGILARAGKVSVTGGTITTTGETTGWVGDNKNMIACQPLVFDAAAQYPGLKEGDGIAVSGGAFSAAVPADYCANGYIPTMDDNGTYSVKEGTFVAQIDESKYESLQAAIDAANGETITLLGDVTLTAPIMVAANKTVAIDGGDFTVTASGVVAMTYGSLTIAGGKFVSGNTAFKVLGEGSISVTNGEISAQEMCIAAFDGGRISVSGGSLTSLDNAVLGTNGSAGRGGNTINVSGGTLVGNIQSTGYIACGIYVANSDTVTVSGGTITVNGGVGILARAGKVSVTGGTITTTGETTGWVGDNKNMIACEPLVFDAAAQYPGLKEGDGIAVSGGAFSAVVPDAYCAEGYEPKLTAEDGEYTVIAATQVVVSDPSAEKAVVTVEKAEPGATYTFCRIDSEGNRTEICPCGGSSGVEIEFGKEAVVKYQIEKACGDMVVTNSTIGVIRCTDVARITPVAVSVSALGTLKDTISLANLVKTSTLTVGDKIYVYDRTANRYDAYQLSENKSWTAIGTWKSGQTESSTLIPAGEKTLGRGAGVWLERQHPENPFYLIGEVKSGKVAVPVEAGTADAPSWNLIGAPSTDGGDLQTLAAGAGAEDFILVPDGEDVKRYVLKDSQWGYYANEVDGNRVRSVWKTDTKVAPGKGFWYVSQGGKPTAKW